MTVMNTDSVNTMIQLTNKTAENADEAERTQMQDSFVRSSAYELAFWQMAMDKQEWTVQSVKQGA